MAGGSTEWKLHPAWRLAAAGLALALSLLVVPAAAEAGKDGGTRYEYKVSQFDYDASGGISAARSDEQCVAGETGHWFGGVVTGASDVTHLGKLGEGSLKIGERGTRGSLKARADVESSFGPAEHTIVTSCDPYEETQTDCTPDPSDLIVEGAGIVRGGVGNNVKIDWAFEQVDINGAWLPDYTCVEPFEFPFDKCQSQAKLSSFTKKRFRLGFACSAEGTPPPGVSKYDATSDAAGSFELTRTKQS